MSDIPSPTSKEAQEARQKSLQEAMALQRDGKRDLAMQRYVAILAEDPTNQDALFCVALVALQEGQLAEGIKVIERALAVGPPQARMHNLMGQAYLRLNQDDDALKAFDRAIECEPGFADAYGNRANLLADMGRLDEAVAAFNRALEVRPDNAEDLCNRGTVLADLGRHGEALADYERALMLMPDLAPAHFNRADILLRLGRNAQALASYDQAIAYSRNSPTPMPIAAACSRRWAATPRRARASSAPPRSTRHSKSCWRKIDPHPSPLIPAPDRCRG